MTHRQKRGLAILGLTIALISIILLAYSAWPLPGVIEKVPLAPTLFVPP